MKISKSTRIIALVSAIGLSWLLGYFAYPMVLGIMEADKEFMFIAIHWIFLIIIMSFETSLLLFTIPYIFSITRNYSGIITEKFFRIGSNGKTSITNYFVSLAMIQTFLKSILLYKSCFYGSLKFCH
jgi:hypothetical protein